MADGPKKQAVVVIHGIGEQRPMQTVRSFVESVWSTDATLDVLAADGERRVWSRPDERFGSHELTRLTTNRLALRPDDDGRLRPGPATDFFELYWQHLMGTSRWQHIVGWLIPLLWRPLGRVPEPLKVAWWTLWGLAAVLAFCGLDALLAQGGGTGLFEGLFGAQATWVRNGVGLLSAVAGLLGANTVLPYLGDASRYLDGAPGNVLARQAIRTEGLRLLRSLQESGEYDRIVVVGHSLGSVIAYDVLRLLWAEQITPRTKRRAPALRELEQAAEALESDDTPANRERYRTAQRAFGSFMATGDSPWLITDLVTLGSPLAHADVLLARDMEDFRQMVAERALPSSPPRLETVDDQRRITFRTGPEGEKRWQTHHAAVFGAVRWTNLYFPYDGWWTGDMIGGPVSPLFGPGVVDVPVTSSKVADLRCHTHYWTLDTNIGEHVTALREALDLARRSG